MSFTLTTTRETLLPALLRAVGAVSRKSTIPILDNLLLRAENGVLTVTGTDIETEIVVAVTPEQASGATCVPAYRLAELVKLLPAGASVKMESDGERCGLTSGRSRYKLPSLPADTYPAFDREGSQTEITLPAGILAELLKRVGYAIAHNDVRYYLNGVLLQVRGDELTAGGSDGHRLAVASYTMQEAPAEGGEWILPAATLQELIRALDGTEGDAVARLGSSSAQFILGAVRISTKLIEGRYPDVRKAIPDPPHTLTLSREEFIQTLRRVTLVSHTEYRGVRLAPSIDALNLSASHADQDGDDALPATWDGPEAIYGVNGNYLLDLAGAVQGEELTLRLGDVTQSMRADTDGDIRATHVVTPMRL